MSSGAPDRPWVARAERIIRAAGLRPEDEPILQRLMTHPRMAAVWRELQRHPVNLSQAERVAAMGQMLHAAYRAVVDNRVATKLDEVIKAQNRLRQEAETLRYVADDVVASVRGAPRYIADTQDFSQYLADAKALHRVAEWRDALAAQMRNADDPMTIKNFRGDPLARGVQITVAAHLKAEFGDYLHGTAAIFTAVALGLDKVPSPRVSRSAFSARKSA